MLTLARSGAILGANDNWGGTATLADAFARAGAFPLAGGSRDAALALPLAAGDYTVQLEPSPAGGAATSGVVLAEVYDLGATGNGVAPRLVNLSTRAPVAAGSGVLIAGFVVGGSTSKTLLIRGVGPSLERFGVSGAMANPQLQVFTSGGVRLTGNDDWTADATLERVGNSVGAFRFTSPLSTDAAVLVTLAPGAYTAQLSGVGGTGGVALIEVYEVP